MRWRRPRPLTFAQFLAAAAVSAGVVLALLMAWSGDQFTAYDTVVPGRLTADARCERTDLKVGLRLAPRYELRVAFEVRVGERTLQGSRYGRQAALYLSPEDCAQVAQAYPAGRGLPVWLSSPSGERMLLHPDRGSAYLQIPAGVVLLGVLVFVLMG